MMRPALFLDRDGVINEEAGYLSRFDQVQFVPGIASLISTANRIGYCVVVVTNQAGIGMGLYTEADFEALMAELRAALRKQGAEIDAVYFSPFHPERGLGRYRRATDCRKPGPGMLLRAQEELRLDLRRSVLVGERGPARHAGAAGGGGGGFVVGGPGAGRLPIVLSATWGR